MCKAPCCQCLPVDGWFTECDYFLFRMLYPAPVDLRAVGHDGKSCFFLGERGCRLPSDMRPFPCVKVNCKNVIEELKRYGRLDAFTALNNELEQLQEKVYPLLADIVSYTVFQAQNYEPPVST
ncbi:MAG: hypothetical protein N3B18_07820 [Desulfobacterota bacterium]|nr:hypothetical protein [Thermodesulfobacteriota bacterium]